MFVIKNLTLTLIEDMRILLEDFNFSLFPGQKIALIGEEGNGKSTLLKAIASPASLAESVEIHGMIDRSDEVIGYLPQEIDSETLSQSTEAILFARIPFDALDYTAYYRLLHEMNLPDALISKDRRLRELSGGEKIKFLLLIEMLKNPTILLLDEPSNDLDLQAVQWLEQFIQDLQIAVLFVSHDEQLLTRCATGVIHIEQLLHKTKPQYTVSGLSYDQYVQNRQDGIVRQTQLAKKEKQEYDEKLKRYQRVYERVQHELRTVSRQDPGTAKNLKDKMHSVKSIGRRLEREKETVTQKPERDTSIDVSFFPEVRLPARKEIINLELPVLKAGTTILSKNISLHLAGPQKICIIGQNGSGKTTLLREIMRAMNHQNIRAAYMPQAYAEMMHPEQNAIDFLTLSGEKEEHTRIRTYLGSMKFTPDEMYRPVEKLSGGQRAKLYFSKMILNQAEYLILDEPTRNLSPLSGPEIRSALSAYQGGIIGASHDRIFITEVFDLIYELTTDGLKIVSRETLMS